MSGELRAAVRRAKQLAKLIESTTFDGERANAMDAYVRICEKYRLDTRTLQPVGQLEAQTGFDRLSEFYLAQALSGGALDYETWIRAAVDAVIGERCGL